MAIPRVFCSSTCYDLKYIRENLRFFIKGLGFEPVLSEEGNVYYDTNLNTQDACLAEVSSCQIFVLIIGGRFGSKYKNTEHSITNAEYREAVRQKIPIFALVEQAVHSDAQVYRHNKVNDQIDVSKIQYPSVDSTAIFDFIDEVSSKSENNAVFPFKDFSDIESYLLQQWAGMMYTFLTRDNTTNRLEDSLQMMQGINQRVEMLSRQILRSVGNTEARLTAELYDKILSSRPVHDMMYWNIRPTPEAILSNLSFEDCVESFGVFLYVDDDPDCEYSVSQGDSISRGAFNLDTQLYEELRQSLIDVLTKYNITVEDFLAQAQES